MKNWDYWKKWLYNAGIRAIKTFAETAASMLTGNMVGILDADWVAVTSVSAMAGVVSLLISLKGLPEVSVEEGE